MIPRSILFDGRGACAPASPVRVVSHLVGRGSQGGLVVVGLAALGGVVVLVVLVIVVHLAAFVVGGSARPTGERGINGQVVDRRSCPALWRR